MDLTAQNALEAEHRPNEGLSKSLGHSVTSLADPNYRATVCVRKTTAAELYCTVADDGKSSSHNL